MRKFNIELSSTGKDPIAKEIIGKEIGTDEYMIFLGDFKVADEYDFVIVDISEKNTTGTYPIISSQTDGRINKIYVSDK